MATDIALRSQELSDGYGVGYVSPYTPVSVRWVVRKSITNLNNGYIRVTLTCECNTNNGYIYPQYIVYLNATIAGITKQVTFKAQSDYWEKNTKHSVSISFDVQISQSSSRSARIWASSSSGNSFTFDSATQGGTTLDGLPTQTINLYAYDSSGTPRKAKEVYVYDNSGTPRLAKEVYVYDGSSTPRLSR